MIANTSLGFVWNIVRLVKQRSRQWFALLYNKNVFKDVLYSLEKQFARGAANGLKM